MITYKDSSNANEYNMLFDRASMKLGLKPIVKAVLDANGDPEYENGEPKYEYYRMVPDQNGGWREEKLNSNDIDSDGNIVIHGESESDNVTLHGISNLNEYFQHISELADLAMGPASNSSDTDLRHGTDPYFLRLPLDEPFFEINANTRTITVPSALSRIGVVGDKYAEIVFFKIDRYFDAIDLDTRHIYIEWEAPGENGQTVKGVSRDFLRDTQSEKDKIIFGWLIDDTLTAHAGTIRFAVRFVEWITNEDSAVASTDLAYSFSSLPAQISVVDSLNYDLFDNSENATMMNTTQQIRNMQLYFENSTPDSADSTAPEEAENPLFVRDINNLENWDEAEGAVGIYTHNLDAANELELIVEAISPDAGNISYAFAKKEDLDDGPQAINSYPYFMEVSLENQINTETNKVVYYRLKPGTTDTFEVASITALNNEIDTNGSAVAYEKVAKTIVSYPGYYYAIARNTVAGKKTGRAESKKVLVPKAEPVSPSVDMPEYFVLNKRTYSIAPDTNTIQSTTSNLVVTISEPEAASITLGEGQVGPQFTIPSEKTNSLSYVWYKDGDEIPGETDSTYTVTAPGLYTVKVTNHFNNSDADLTVTTPIKVMSMPSTPTLDFEAWASVIQAGNFNTSIPVNPVEDGGIIWYEWHRVTTNQTDLDQVADGYMENPEGAVGPDNKIPFKPIHTGFFYLVLRHYFVDNAGNKIAEVIVNSGARDGVIQVDTDVPRYEVTFTSAPGDTYEAEILETLPEINPAVVWAEPGDFSPNTPEDVVIEGVGTWRLDHWEIDDEAVELPVRIINAAIELTAVWNFISIENNNDNNEEEQG